MSMPDRFPDIWVIPPVDLAGFHKPPLPISPVTGEVVTNPFVPPFGGNGGIPIMSMVTNEDTASYLGFDFVDDVEFP
jgi:hypothetical protein